jgi:Beta-propeller repeat
VGSPVSRAVSRSLFCVGIAILSQAGWLACADDGRTANQRLVQSGIPTAPAFEEETQPGSAGRYSWRNRNIEAKLDTQGGISFQFPDGRQLGITFTGANPGVEPQGESAPYPVSYYLGPPSRWRSGIRWERVRYREIYPGIDLVLVTNAGQLEFNLEIRPGADPGKIRIRYRGAAIQLNQNGDLVIRLGREQIQQRRAFAFQGAFQGDGVENEQVQCSYHLERHSLERDVTLRLSRYDSRLTLTIDPVLNFSTYLGGPGYDAINALTADSAGNIYVTGTTSSSSLLPGGLQSVRASREAWVAKLNSAGTQLLYLVYLGGSGSDSGQGIAVDTSGNAYVTGVTNSTDFPTTSGAFSTRSAGPQEAFIAKFGPAGQLEYSTYLGGGADAGFAIAVDTTGAVYVAGQTESSSFPVTAGTIQPFNQGALSNCFISKLNAAGNALLYSTYLGGSVLDLCTGIAIDASDDAYVTGTTRSTNFPIQMALQSNLIGLTSAFVAEINPTASALLYSTYLGGSVVDNGNAIAVDSFGSAYIAGATSSPNFPTTAGAAQTVLAGQYNAFVAKLTPGGKGLTYSTLIGGSGSDSATAIAIDSSGQAVVGGFTTSPNFPVVNALQSAFQLGRDAFATVLSAGGSSLVFSSYFGGAGDNRGFAVAASPPNSLALGGMTNSATFPTAAALQSSLGGNYDGFLLGMQYQGVQPIALAFFPLTPCRIADTRVGSGFTGAFGAPSLSGGVARGFPIPTSNCDVPATAQAYSLNITVVPPGPLGYLTAWPTGSAVPLVATLNSLEGQVVGNAAIVSAGTNGSMSLVASNTTDVVIDINGYFAPPLLPLALAFYPVTPCRVADTRSGSSGSGLSGVFGPPSLVGGATRNFPMPASSCPISPSAQAYSVRMTVVAPGPLGYLTTWPAGQSIPTVATLNALDGGVVGNEAIVPGGTSGAISVFASNDTDLVIDINGYFAAPGNPGAMYFYSLTPCRVADTRSGSTGSGLSGAFGPPALVGGATRDFPMLSSSCAISPEAQAYSLNVTVVPPGPLGFLTAWPAGQPLPVAATVNALTGDVVGSAAIVAAGTSGGMNVFASNPTQLILDINGYFAP